MCAWGCRARVSCTSDPPSPGQLQPPFLIFLFLLRLSFARPQMSPSMHGTIGVENEFGKGRIEYGSGGGDSEWSPLASSQPDVELLVL